MILGQALKMLIQSYGFGSFLKCLAFDPSQITPECWTSDYVYMY